MRSILYSLLSLATFASALAIEPAKLNKNSADDDLDAKQPDTIFNGQTVPPMIELGQEALAKSISKGNWLVEFYSPECGHCMRFKPTYQTAYEFYSTSKPIVSKDSNDGDSLNAFTRYYDFKFAKVDCRAYGDICAAHDVLVYPSLVYFKDGKEVQREKGAKDMEGLSKWIEQLLEAIRPGTRKEGGPKLPKAGAKSVETGPDTQEATKEREKEKDDAKKSVSSASKTQATESAKAAPPKAKPTSNANPSGLVEALTPDKFEKLVTNTLDPWFIKFYAPWCHHCQQLAPNWINLARQMQGKVNIGEVNCDVEKKLCKDAGVRGYPTMLLYRGSERIEYDGLRGIGDLLDYGEKVMAVGSGVPDVDAEAFKKMEEKDEVIFTYFYDTATTSEDFQALERLTLSLVGHGKLVKTNDADLAKRFKISSFPRLIVSRDGKPTSYPPTTPREMRDVKKVIAWMKSVWLPIFPELTSSNAREIMDGKLVALGVLNREHTADFALAKREMKSAALEWIDKQEAAFKLARQELRDAKQLRIEEAEDKSDEHALRDAKSIRIEMDKLERTQVGFAWVDGAFWDRWIRSTYGVDIKDGDRVIINDEQNHRYWDTTASGEPIRTSRASILETLSQITSNPSKIAAKSTRGGFTNFFYSVHSLVTNHFFLGLGLIVGFFTIIVLFGRRRRSFGKGGFQMGEKDGLLGGLGNGNGGAKHD